MGKKVSVIGAGNVGSAVAYTLAMQYEDIEELLLIDINEKKAVSEALDIEQSTASRAPVCVRAGKYEDAAGSDFVVITSGIGRRADQSRLMESFFCVARMVLENRLRRKALFHLYWMAIEHRAVSIRLVQVIEEWNTIFLEKREKTRRQDICILNLKRKSLRNIGRLESDRGQSAGNQWISGAFFYWTEKESDIV